MGLSYYFVLTRPTPGREDAYHHWYSERHVYDLVAIPGIVAAQRFRLLDRVGDTLPDHLALYEISDVPLAIAGLAERRGTDRMPSTDALDRARSRGVICETDGALAPIWAAEGGHVAFLTVPDDLAPPDVDGDPDTLLLRAGPVQSRPGPLAFTHAVVSPGVRARPADTSHAMLEGIASPITPRILARD